MLDNKAWYFSEKIYNDLEEFNQDITRYNNELNEDVTGNLEWRPDEIIIHSKASIHAKILWNWMR